MSRAFLKIVSGAKVGLNVPLSEDTGLTIGRNRGDLILDDTMISGQHCRLRWQDGAWVLKDLGSTNGTLVDGRTVREQVLAPGAELTLGSTRLLLMVEAGDPPVVEAPAPSSEVEIAWLLDEELIELRGNPERTGSNADVIGQDLRLPPGLNAGLEVVAGQDTGRFYRFTRGNVTIGRRTGEIPLSDPEVSRSHAVIEVFGREMVFLRDLGSTNGTFHNGRKAGVALLRSGDTVGVGKTVMKLQLTR